jgi:hypothetical protein
MIIYGDQYGYLSAAYVIYDHTYLIAEVNGRGYLDTVSPYSKFYAEYLYTPHIRYIERLQWKEIIIVLVSGMFL